jgi:hypothetical protein
LPLALRIGVVLVCVAAANVCATVAADIGGVAASFLLHTAKKVVTAIPTPHCIAAAAADALVVVAAGNERIDVANGTTYPSGYVGRCACALHPALR